MHYSQKHNKLSSMPLFIYGLTVFSGAFLLFQIQPIIGKYILPWFGGSPEVWTMCMLCFQVLLLAGYGYAHLSTSLFGKTKAAIVHITLLVIAIIALPIIPPDQLKPDGSANPVLQVLAIITSVVGLEFFVLASTGPLIQSWFSNISNKEPYRLYSLSNAGSLLALLSYPFLVAPALTRSEQAKFWAIGLLAFAFLCALCSISFAAKGKCIKKEIPDSNEQTKIPKGTIWLWIAMAMAGSVMLLAVTNKISQDISVVPVFWVVPLSLYLLSFIICFDHARWYKRRLWLTAFIISIGLLALTKIYQETISTQLYMLFMCILLFCSCMVCHGQLYSIRPDAKHLTKYYLMIATGGALGGIFVGIIAPLLFNTYCEIYLGIGACVLFTIIADSNQLLKKSRRMRFLTAMLVVCGIILIFSNERKQPHGEKLLSQTRNFFGIISVTDNDIDNTKMRRKVMNHGITFHGLQFADEQKSFLPTAYYSKFSGIGRAFASMEDKDQLRIGVVGLGVGTIATYGRENDYVRFYEINPEVERLARKHFSYLERCEAITNVVIGDARLSMEKESSQNYDLLAIDAFSSDAIPVHLLTKESLQVYLKHVKQSGIIAFHLSNQHLDLEKTVFQLAKDANLESAWIENMENEEKGIFESSWVLLSRDKHPLNHRLIRTATGKTDITDPTIRLWTDEYVNLFKVLKQH